MYTDWKSEHSCSINHEGKCMGNMEVNGLKRMFSRSIRLNKLRYNFYIGVEMVIVSVSMKYITKLNPYPRYKIEKGECIGHVQKRVGTRLRSIKKDYKNKILLDGKGIGGGKGRLTDKVINTLQNHYGMAIDKTLTTYISIIIIYAMRKAVAAVLHHSTNDPDSKKCHSFSPRRPDS